LIPQLENYIPTVKGSALIRIHDVFPITNPKWFRRLSANAFRITLSRAVEDGHTFICNSKYTEASFLEIFPTAVTFVLYCNPKRPPLLACRKCSHCKLAEIPSKKYLISVGTIEPRKNFHTLVSSWNKVKDQVGINLIIVGRYGWKSKKTLKVIQHSGSSIIYIDDICDYGLSELISKSSGYVSVSLDEGFNFPAMDAALAGVPLIISDIPIHRELYGDSPYYFNPKNTYDIQKGLKSEYREAPKISGEFLNKNQEFDKDLKKIFEFVNLKMLGGNL
jgi:glycosyltransferase involved in cell wall biosynthesis